MSRFQYLDELLALRRFYTDRFAPSEKVSQVAIAALVLKSHAEDHHV